jgi:hypothetical protein
VGPPKLLDRGDALGRATRKPVGEVIADLTEVFESLPPHDLLDFTLRLPALRVHA